MYILNIHIFQIGKELIEKFGLPRSIIVILMKRDWCRKCQDDINKKILVKADSASIFIILRINDNLRPATSHIQLRTFKI